MHRLINQITNIEIQLKDILSEYSLLKQALFETIEQLQDTKMELEQVKLERDSLSEQGEGIA